MSILHAQLIPSTTNVFRGSCVGLAGHVTRADEPVSVNQLEAAKLLGISDRTLRDWERRGLITGRRPNGGAKLYPYDRVKELARANGRSL